MIRQSAVVVMIFSALILGGCGSRSLNSNVYSQSQALRTQTVNEGVIVALAPVVIEDSENPVGTLAGAALGSLAGHQVGGGSGKTAGAIVGAVAGGMAGDEISRSLNSQNGVNITIRLQNNQMISVVQAVNPEMVFSVGQRVLVYGQGNTSRVVPAGY